MKPLHRLTTGLATLALAAASPAQPLVPEGPNASVPFDPGAICDALRDAYADAPFLQRVTVTVRRTGGGERTDTLTISAGPPTHPGDDRAIVINLGPLTIWNDADTVYAVHERAPDAYFAAAIEPGATPLDTIEQSFPPIPAPQLALILDADRGCPDHVAYAPDIRWTECTVNAEARPALATMRAEGDGVVLELDAELEPVRLRRYEIVLEEQDLRIIGEVRHGAADDARPDPRAIDLSMRTRVVSVADLAPAAGGLRIGDILSPWLVHPVTPQTPGVVDELVPIGGPCVMVMFTEWNRDTSLGLKSALEATGGFDEYRVIPLAVFDPESDAEPDADTADEGLFAPSRRDAPPDVRTWLDGIRPMVRPLQLYFTRAPERTIRRVSEHAHVGVVVIDAGGVVRLSERIDKIYAFDEPGVLTNRIIASITAR